MKIINLRRLNFIMEQSTIAKDAFIMQKEERKLNIVISIKHKRKMQEVDVGYVIKAKEINLKENKKKNKKKVEVEVELKSQ